MDGKQIGVDVLDKNFKIRGLGPDSELFIRPVSKRYYRVYECRANNKYGTAMHPIELSVASPPGMIRDAFKKKKRVNFGTLSQSFPTVGSLSNGSNNNSAPSSLYYPLIVED